MTTHATPLQADDATPLRGPWIEPNTQPEAHSWDNQVLMADGTTCHGVFMPEGGWFVRDAYRAIVGWRKLENRQITAGCDRRVAPSTP
jgi:hypothetical protein